MPLWIAAPSTALIAVGVFLMQFFVQGAWGVIPAHINELSPGHLRGFFPGFAYQLGVLVASSITYVESVLGEHFTLRAVDGRARRDRHGRRHDRDRRSDRKPAASRSARATTERCHRRARAAAHRTRVTFAVSA